MGVFISLMIFYITLFVALVSLRADIVKLTKWWQHVLLALFLFGWGSLGTLDVLVKDHGNQEGIQQITEATSTSEKRLKKVIDSTRDAVSDSFKNVARNAERYNQEQAEREKNTKEDLLKKMDDKELNPLLDIVPVSIKEKNPIVLATDTPGVLLLKMTAHNLRAVEGYPTWSSFAIVHYINKRPIVEEYQPKKGSYLQQPIYNEKTNYQDLNLEFRFTPSCLTPKYSLDTLYACWELKYENKAGKQQPPLRKIFMFNCNSIGKQLEMETWKHSEIKDFLFSKKYW